MSRYGVAYVLPQKPVYKKKLKLVHRFSRESVNDRQTQLFLNLYYQYRLFAINGTFMENKIDTKPFFTAS